MLSQPHMTLKPAPSARLLQPFRAPVEPDFIVLTVVFRLRVRSKHIHDPPPLGSWLLTTHTICAVPARRTVCRAAGGRHAARRAGRGTALPPPQVLYLLDPEPAQQTRAGSQTCSFAKRDSYCKNNRIIADGACMAPAEAMATMQPAVSL